MTSQEGDMTHVDSPRVPESRRSGSADGEARAIITSPNHEGGTRCVNSINPVADQMQIPGGRGGVAHFSLAATAEAEGRHASTSSLLPWEITFKHFPPG